MDHRFLYVDIEWNQMGKRIGPSDEILEIGAVSAIDEYIVERYFKYIKPSRPIKQQTFYFLNITPMDLKHGENIDNALCSLQQLWNDSECIVVWSLDSLNMLKSAFMQRNIFIELSNVIVLQDLLVKILDNKYALSFENTLMKFGALYDRSRMHNAGFDAECLKSLFDLIYDKYRKTLLNDNLSLIESIRTKIIHTSNCKYGRRILELNRTEVPIYKLLQERNCCKSCISTKYNITFELQDSSKYEELQSIRKLKGKSVETNQIDSLLNYFQLEYTQQHTYILISTEYSSWRIYYSDGYVKKLEHQNYRYGYSKGFHNQNIALKDLYSVLEYIINHEKNPHKKKKIVEREKQYNREIKKKRMQKERRIYEEDDDFKNWKMIY